MLTFAKKRENAEFCFLLKNEQRRVCVGAVVFAHKPLNLRSWCCVYFQRAEKEIAKDGQEIVKRTRMSVYNY